MSDYCIENDLPRQQELEAIRQTKLMRDVSYLLLDPGGDVVRQLLDEIDSLKHWLKHYQERTSKSEYQLATAHREGWEQGKRDSIIQLRQHGCDENNCRDMVGDAIAAMEYGGKAND